MNLDKQILGKTLAQWQDAFPIMKKIANLEETLWINSGRLPFDEAIGRCPLSMEDVQDASDRLSRFADYFKVAFPETRSSEGILESPLQAIPAMQTCLEEDSAVRSPGGFSSSWTAICPFPAPSRPVAVFMKCCMWRKKSLWSKAS